MPPITGPDTGGTETRANQPPALSWAGCSGDLPAVPVVDDSGGRCVWRDEAYWWTAG